MTRAGASPASRRPPRCRGARADDDEQVDDAAGGLADGAVAVVVRLAELEHLAEDRHAPAGQTRRAGRAPRTTEPGDAL